METRRLEYFVRIADAGSINRAATALGIAQPALSQQLAILEAELKTELFTRSRTGVVLTEAGRRLYPRAQTILRQFEALTMSAGADDAASLVAVGLPPTLVMTIGLRLVERVLAEHPRIRLYLVEASAIDLVGQLESGALDMALIPSAPVGPQIVATPLAREEMVILTAADAPAPPTAPQDLAAMPWIVTRYPNILRGILSAWFQRAEKEPLVVAEINSLPIVLALVERGKGVTLLPRSAVAERVSAGTLAAWPMQPSPLWRTINYCRHREAPSSTAFDSVESVIRSLVADCLEPL